MRKLKPGASPSSSRGCWERQSISFPTCEESEDEIDEDETDKDLDEKKYERKEDVMM